MSLSFLPARFRKLALAFSLACSSAAEAKAADVVSTNYPSIQAAIDANPGGVITVPAGDHLIDSTLRISSHGTSLVGSGRILLTDPAHHILEVEHSGSVRISGLTFSRPDGKMDTQRPGVLLSDVNDITLDQVKIIDNHSPAGSLRLSDSRGARILNCEIENYMTIAVDDRTQNTALLGYAFRCIDGTGIVCDNARGTLIQGTLIIEKRLRPIPEIKEQNQLGKFTKKNPEKGSLISQAAWDAEYVNNWHQGSGLIVTGPTYSDFTRIIGNQIVNAAQGIDIHSDHVIISSNIVDNAFIGMKAMHGSRNVLITGNQFCRNDLWAIGLMSGAGAASAQSAGGDRPAVPGNVDGGSVISNNIISQFGQGDAAWMWKEANRAVLRFDNGQESTDPPLRDVVIMGNVISNTDNDERLPTIPMEEQGPRYHYAVRIESGAAHSPRGLHFVGNLFPAGLDGVSNSPLLP